MTSTPRRRRAITVAAALVAVAICAGGLAAYELGRRRAAVPELVWVTPRGSRYHRADCRHAAGRGVATPLEQARLRYRPCSVCGPPVK